MDTGIESNKETDLETNKATPMKSQVAAVAIIPARGGSKRIAGKNIKAFSGKPLIAYSIEAAKKSGIFSRIIVSTDNDEIASVAKSFGAETPFTRPPSISDDHTPVGEVVKHAIQWLKEKGTKAEFVCCIYATAPMVAFEDIVRGYEALKQARTYRSALAVAGFEFPIQRALKLDGEKGLKMIQPQYKLTRSQDLDSCYHDAGQFFWIRNTRKGIDRRCGYLPILIDRKRVQDIDTPEDWLLAEYQHKVISLMEEDDVLHA